MDRLTSKNTKAELLSAYEESLGAQEQIQFLGYVCCFLLIIACIR